MRTKSWKVVYSAQRLQAWKYISAMVEFPEGQWCLHNWVENGAKGRCCTLVWASIFGSWGGRRTEKNGGTSAGRNPARLDGKWWQEQWLPPCLGFPLSHALGKVSKSNQTQRLSKTLQKEKQNKTTTRASYIYIVNVQRRFNKGQFDLCEPTVINGRYQLKHNNTHTHVKFTR